MLLRPALVARYDQRTLRDECVLLLSDRREHALCGALYVHLVPLLTGQLTADEIADRVPHDPAEVYYALMELEALGILCEADGAAQAGAAVGPISAHGAPVRATVAVQVVGSLPRGLCETALRRHGFVVRNAAECTVVFADDYLRPELDDLNRAALRASRPWLLVKPLGDEIWVGPLFVPRVTGCWRCLEQRLAHNRPVAAFLFRHGTPPAPRRAGWDLGLGCDIAVSLLAPHFGDPPSPELSGVMLTCDPTTGQVERHAFTRRPQCPACGDPTLYARQLGEPVVPVSRRKRFTTDGGHRWYSPEETLRRFARLMSPLTGVVKSVARLETSDTGTIQVAVASYAGPGRPDGPAALREHLRQQSGGKGVSEAQTRCSAFGEALERYSGTFHGDEPVIVASLNEVGDCAIHPDRCLLFSDAQFQQREAWNRLHGPRQRVPIPFQPSTPIAWTPVWSLTAGAPRYLPTMYLFYEYPAAPEQRYCPADSNGSAAGLTREEAMLQGLLELVERDSVALWWYNRVSRPAVALESLKDSWCGELTRSYRAMGRELWVLDITADLQIPACAAVSRRVDTSEQLLVGFGAHLDARLAVRRALTEMNQLLAVVHAARRGGKTLEAETASWLATATLAQHPHLRPGPFPPVDISRFPRLASKDFRDDVLLCQRSVEERGMELLVLDQTRVDVGVPVMKVIVPGLRHFWARFGPGRLYDVPVALGWLARPRAEAELNPVAVFF
jgi:bacteriocin biosynthesis cyclodehydratase domain-containing protein